MGRVAGKEEVGEGTLEGGKENRRRLQSGRFWTG